jgi:hypothetical protein
MHSINPTFTNTSTLPQKEERDFYVPEDSDIKKILDHAAGTRYEIALWLATYGMRRSEICALTVSDLSEDNIITVNKAKVQDDDGRWHIKTVKTVQSARKFKIDDDLAELIRKKDEYVYEGSPGQINEYLQATQKKLGIEKFSLHKMRHYFASTAREVMPDSYVEKLGGWKPGSEIMKKVYDYQKKKHQEQLKAIVFFMRCVGADCARIAIENPSGIMSTIYQKPDCVYNPYDFSGETECKKTCLWLKGLPPLKPTQNLPNEKRTRGIWKAHFDGKAYAWNSPETARLRSVTPKGVAQAMAEQWG